MPDAEGPGRLDNSFYDLLASEARLASFIAIAKGDVPEAHWFHLGRLVTSVSGTPTLLSWSGTLFEYLMPLLVMSAIPRRCSTRPAGWPCAAGRVRRGERGVPWGISECAYNLVDRHGNYQYKAFGVPGLGLKRGLGDELVVAPYATALAAMVEPQRAAAQPAAALGRAALGRLRLLRGDRLHARDARASSAPNESGGAPRAPWCAPTWPITRA